MAFHSEMARRFSPKTPPTGVLAMLPEKSRHYHHPADAWRFLITPHIESVTNNKLITAAGANLGEFIDVPLSNSLHLDAFIAHPDTAGSTLSVRSGSFLIGAKSFGIQPATRSGKLRDHMSWFSFSK